MCRGGTVQPGEEGELEQLRIDVANLAAGLASNRLIGTAIGLVMAQHSVDRQTAYSYLCRVSQDTNVKLVKVARALVSEAEDQAQFGRR